LKTHLDNMNSKLEALHKRKGKKQSNVYNRQRRLRGQMTERKDESPLQKLQRLTS
jgi:hypothetical protein